MERIWRLAVAIFFLCAGVALIALAWLFENTTVGVVALFAALIFIPIGLIKGLYDVIQFGSKEDKQEE